MVYNVPVLAYHNFHSAGTQLLCIGQAYTTLTNTLSLIAPITIDHPNASTLPPSSAYFGYTYSTPVAVNFTFTGTAIKFCAAITLPVIDVWMVVAKGVFGTSVGLTTQY